VWQGRKGRARPGRRKRGEGSLLTTDSRLAGWDDCGCLVGSEGIVVLLQRRLTMKLSSASGLVVTNSTQWHFKAYRIASPVPSGHSSHTDAGNRGQGRYRECQEERPLALGPPNALMMRVASQAPSLGGETLNKSPSVVAAGR